MFQKIVIRRELSQDPFLKMMLDYRDDCSTDCFQEGNLIIPNTMISPL